MSHYLIQSNRIINDPDINSGVKEILEKSMINNAGYIMNTLDFYKNWLDKEDIDFENLTTEDKELVFNIAMLSNSFNEVYLKFINTDEISNLAVDLTGMFWKLYSSVLINNNKELDEEKHRKILLIMLILEFFNTNDHMKHFDKIFAFFMDYFINYEQNIIDIIKKQWEESTEINIKNYHENTLFYHLFNLEYYGKLGDNKSLFDELFNKSKRQLQCKRSMYPGQFTINDAIRNINKQFVSRIDIMELYDKIYDPENKQFEFNSEIIIESIQIIDYFKSTELADGINSILNKKIQTRLIDDINYQTNIKVDWSDITNTNKQIINEMINNIKNAIENKENPDIENDEIINQTLTNSWARIENNYNFFNSTIFKRTLINNIEIESIREIAESFYNVGKFTDDVKYFNLANELTLIYLTKSLNEIIEKYFNENSFEISDKDLHLTTAYANLINRVFKVQNQQWVTLYEKYKQFKIEHFKGKVNKLIKYYESIKENGEKMCVGYDLTRYLIKMENYGHQFDNELSTLYNNLKITYKLINEKERYIQDRGKVEMLNLDGTPFWIHKTIMQNSVNTVPNSGDVNIVLNFILEGYSVTYIHRYPAYFNLLFENNIFKLNIGYYLYDYLWFFVDRTYTESITITFPFGRISQCVTNSKSYTTKVNLKSYENIYASRESNVSKGNRLYEDKVHQTIEITIHFDDITNTSLLNFTINDNDFEFKNNEILYYIGNV